MTKFLATQTGQKIAYSFTKGTGPTVVFLGGFKSDMEGSKAIFLEKWARKRNRSFLRFDYSGHGQSSGDFLNLGIGDWFNDAKQIIQAFNDLYMKDRNIIKFADLDIDVKHSLGSITNSKLVSSNIYCK